jgi:hypothetical protein
VKCKLHHHSAGYQNGQQLQIFTVLDKFILKYEEAIVKWKLVDIIYPSASQNPVNMFPKLKLNREIRLLVNLVPHNKITVKDHGPIPN